MKVEKRKLRIAAFKRKNFQPYSNTYNAVCISLNYSHPDEP